MNKISNAKIIVIQGDIQPSNYSLDDQECTIGRFPTCNVVINDKQEVSRLHAKIIPKGPRYLLCDERSVNGTFVNGAEIHEPYLLTNQDTIGFGSPAPLLRFEDMDPTSVNRQLLIHYDKDRASFFIDKKCVELPLRLFRLLELLYRNAGEVCSRRRCCEAMTGQLYDPDLDNAALDRAINRLRKRLDPKVAKMIKVRRSFGYILELEE